MIDINDARAALDASVAGAANGTEVDALGFAVHIARKALDELEALRKPVAESRVYQPVGSTRRLPLLAACANAGLTEELTIGHLEARIATLESERAELLEKRGVPVRASVPLTPAVDPRAERLVSYRCAAVIAFGALHTAEKIEGHAHAMLAAERSPDAE